MSDPLSLIEKFSRLRVLVIGEAILDRYLYGCATRLCQETPVPVVTLTHTIEQPGGAANTAVNLSSLGAQVSLISVIGKDWEGTRLQQTLNENKIETKLLEVSPNRSTLTKQRVIDGDRLVLRFDQGSINAISTELEQKVILSLKTLWQQYDAVIISDYGYGILTPHIIHTIAQLQLQHPKILVVDAKELIPYKILKATAVKPNYQQVIKLLNREEVFESINFSRVDYVQYHAKEILELTGAKIVAITLDQEGAIILQPNQPSHRIYANPACPTRTIGAGDTFTAAFTVALATGAKPTIAAELAAAAAATVVSKSGTAICTINELKASFQPVLLRD